MKFPLKVFVKTSRFGLCPAEVSIAAVNALVKKGNHKQSLPSSAGITKSSEISLRVTCPNSTVVTHRASLTNIYLPHDLTNNCGAELEAEINRRIKQKSDATINFGSKNLKPVVCLRVELQATTTNGLPVEHPAAVPRFKVRLKYWDGSNHHLWASYNPETDALVIKGAGLKFVNHGQVLQAIRELMPK